MHMTPRPHPHFLQWFRQMALAGLALTCSLGAIAQTGAPALRASHAAMAEQLRQNQFGRPLVLDSAESPNDLKGDIYAVVEHPFAVVSAALNEPGEWCDVLILHLNTKYCAVKKAQGTVISMAVGKKFDQPLADTYKVDFNWQSVAASPDYLEIQLQAPNGPLGTNNYRIVLQAVPLDGGRTFLHLRYSYGFGFAGRMAMKAYLATAGSDKVGFTVTGKDSAGTPQFIGGVRGVVERNTMRYYLAIDAYLSALSTPVAGQLDKRLQAWFNSTERYGRQLHEIERGDYVAMKRSEYQRQQSSQ
ncbi:hypothetical protein BH11PSE7_BH11PSE7_23610 [soil metagenome]